MDPLGFELRTETGVTVLTSDVVNTSAIEGEMLDQRQVRSSIARRLGLDAAGLPKPSRDVEGVVEMMLDATQNSAAPLTVARLFGWHASLFPTPSGDRRGRAVGAWRSSKTGPMQVVSGPLGHERVHFEAPEAARLEIEMARFLGWYNGPSALDPALKAGIAHLWFVTVHPFEDGNGRIARAIADMTLARGDGSRQRFYSMSSRIEAERKEYYFRLESAQRGDLDITAWLAWFLGCLDRAVETAEINLAAVLRKAGLWQHINQRPVNDRQRAVINRLLDNYKGFLTTSKYAHIAKCSTDTALRDIRELVDWGVLVQNAAGGRSTSYRLAGEAADQG